LPGELLNRNGQNPSRWRLLSMRTAGFVLTAVRLTHDPPRMA
jgi:hypothetical protein